MATQLSRGILSSSIRVAVLVILVASCNSDRGTSTASAGPVPVPPTADGCYVYNSSSHQWSKVACLTPAQKSQLPHLTIGGSTGAFGLPGVCVGTCGANVNSFITAASISVSFPTVNNPAEAASGVVPIYSVIDTPGQTGGGTGRNSFSMQANTNRFSITCQPSTQPSGQSSCVQGDIGVVQFTYQADFGPVGLNFFGWGTASALCVTSVDNTTMNFNNQSCVSLPLPWGNFGWFLGPGTSQVLQLMAGESNQKVWAMMCPPWGSGAPNACWTVVASDVFGLCLNPTGSQCAWGQVSGSLLGFGNGSIATFPAGVTMDTVVTAVACSPPSSYVIPFTPFPPLDMGSPINSLAALQCPTPTSSNYLPGPLINEVVTQESNNLTPTVPSVASIIPDCVLGSCWIEYLASD